jgi:DNA-binding response OmpR family regulator
MSSADDTMTVLVYSDDANTRAQILMAIGRRPAADLPRAEYVECATGPAVFSHLDRGGIDVAVLDAEAQPEGGLGIARQAKDEIYDCPPLLAIIARRDDGWLATWSRADAVVSQPLDPMALARAVADLMRGRAGSGRLAVQ